MVVPPTTFRANSCNTARNTVRVDTFGESSQGHGTGEKSLRFRQCTKYSLFSD
jgi:hypothetical protein